MHQSKSLQAVIVAGMLCAGAWLSQKPAYGQLNTGGPQILSTGQWITPLAPFGASFQPLNPQLPDNPTYTAGQAVTTTVSPDGKTLLILTSGYNLWAYTTGPNAGNENPADSNEYVFVFDISHGRPLQKQVLQVPNTYSGIAFNPAGTQFYVAGGCNDLVHIFGLTAGVWSEVQTPVALGHLATVNPELGNYGGLGLETEPLASGLSVSQNGQTIVVANYENDSVSVLTQSAGGWAKSAELDLRPGVIDPATSTGTPGGEYPYWVSIVGNSTAYVTSIRDREVDVVDIATPAAPSLLTRISVKGNPNRSLLSKDQSLLYVAQDNTDSIAVISTNTNTVLGEIQVGPPLFTFPGQPRYNGANPNSVALSPDGRTLYVTDGALNAVAVVSLFGRSGQGEVTGLIPTGFYPNSVSVSADGRMLYIVNGKSATGPNPLYCHAGVPYTNGETPNCNASNQYDWQLTKAGFQTVPTPEGFELGQLTQQVFQNDHFGPRWSPHEQWIMAQLHQKIQHVIYIIKENRTYDQVLGDLPVGNGDPEITQFGQAITPNLHAIAGNFVDFDNFYDVSDVSGDGWPWSTSARTTDTIEKEIPVEYANRGGDDNAEGENRNVNVGVPNFATREAEDPLEAIAGDVEGGAENLLPGEGNVAAPDSSEGGIHQGYIWNAVNQAGLSVRDYGMIEDLDRYDLPAPFDALFGIPLDPTPYADGVQVAFSASPFLTPYTDIYFRGFDNSFPDYYRFQEWNREFQQFDANGNLPNLSLVRLMHDHTGNFSTAIGGVNTPELDVADNDYAVGLLVQAVANSKNYSHNTLIFVIEDDSQDGGDHVDAHRSIAFIVGPYVRQGYVASKRYNTVSMLRTIEDILGTPHLNLNDAYAEPMADAFDLHQPNWNFTATPSALLADTTLPIPSSAFDSAALRNPPRPQHDSTWWAAQTQGMDFSIPDHLDTAKYNRVLWEGTMGNKPYPVNRSGVDLRQGRAQLLKQYQQEQQKSAASQPAVSTVGNGAGN
jgi:DNA-binding beta-propeller fold protein YncE